MVLWNIKYKQRMSINRLKRALSAHLRILNFNQNTVESLKVLSRREP